MKKSRPERSALSTDGSPAVMALAPSTTTRREKTASSRVGGYQTLGDMGFVDEDGWLYIVDRRVDLIVSGGVNIYPAEIEAALIQHPDVVDVAVIGVPDSEWGHVVAAVVELADWRRAGPDIAAELDQFARSQLAAFKCPRSIDFRR